VNGGNGQWKRLCSRLGHALNDDDEQGAVILRKVAEGLYVSIAVNTVPSPSSRHRVAQKK